MAPRNARTMAVRGQRQTRCCSTSCSLLASSFNNTPRFGKKERKNRNHKTVYTHTLSAHVRSHGRAGSNCQFAKLPLDESLANDNFRAP